VADRKPKWPLKELKAAAESVGIELGKARALDVLLVHVDTMADAIRLTEQLIASLEEVHFVGTKVLDPPLAGEYDEYVRPLTDSLVQNFALDPGDWYLGLKFRGADVSVFCISVHPSTKPGGKR